MRPFFKPPGESGSTYQLTGVGRLEEGGIDGTGKSTTPLIKCRYCFLKIHKLLPSFLHNLNLIRVKSKHICSTSWTWLDTVGHHCRSVSCLRTEYITTALYSLKLKYSFTQCLVVVNCLKYQHCSVKVPVRS